MIVVLHKSFVKKYAKLDEKIKLRFKERRDLFMANPMHPMLNNHPLTGEYDGIRSINITGDVRAHYVELSAEEVIFVDIDTHSNLYGK